MPSDPITALKQTLGPDDVLSDPAELLVYECDGFTIARSRPSVTALIGLLPGYYGATSKPQWREAAQYISSSWQEGTAILLIGKRESKPLRYYFRRRDNPIPERKVSTVDPDQVLSRIKNSDRVIAVYARGRKSTAVPTLRELRRYGRTVGRVPLHGVAVVELSIDRNRVKKQVRKLADKKH